MAEALMLSKGYTLQALRFWLRQPDNTHTLVASSRDPRSNSTKSKIEREADSASGFQDSCWVRSTAAPNVIDPWC